MIPAGVQVYVASTPGNGSTNVILIGGKNISTTLGTSATNVPA